MDAEDWERIRARDPNIAGYEDFRSLLCPSSAPGVLYTYFGVWLHALVLLLRFGVLKLKRAMVTAEKGKPERACASVAETAPELDQKSASAKWPRGEVLGRLRCLTEFLGFDGDVAGILGTLRR